MPAIRARNAQGYIGSGDSGHGDTPVKSALNRDQLEALYHASVERLADTESGSIVFLRGFGG